MWDGKYSMYYCVFMDKPGNQLKRIRVAVSEDDLYNGKHWSIGVAFSKDRVNFSTSTM